MTWMDVLKVVVTIASSALVIGVIVALVATSIIDDLIERDKKRNK